MRDPRAVRIEEIMHGSPMTEEEVANLEAGRERSRSILNGSISHLTPPRVLDALIGDSVPVHIPANQGVFKVNRKGMRKDEWVNGSPDIYNPETDEWVMGR